LLTPPKLGDTFDSKVVVLDLTPSIGNFDEELKAGVPLLMPLKPVAENDLVSRDVELDLSLPPKGDPPNTDFCSPFIAPNDPGEDAPKSGTPLLTPPKPGGDVIFESKAVTLDLTPPPKAGAPLFKPVGEDDLFSTDVELDLTFPLKGDPPIADFCCPFIVPRDPDDDAPKPESPLLTPPKPGGDVIFESKVVVLDLTPPVEKFDEEPKPRTLLLMPVKLGGPPLIGDCGEEPKPVDPLSIPSSDFTLSFAVVPHFNGDV
jgi:hypothetical protein